jgi:hypothetical protein
MYLYFNQLDEDDNNRLNDIYNDVINSDPYLQISKNDVKFMLKIIEILDNEINILLDRI